MESNTSIMSYKLLIEMEAENHKLNEMIMAPKFAKLLNESVDTDDFKLHNCKTKEFTSVFVNTSFDNTITVMNAVTESINNLSCNSDLNALCEMKHKSLFREDRDIVIEDCDISESISEAVSDLMSDITLVNDEFCKILESSINTKEEYTNIIKPFINLVSEHSDKLDKIDLSTMERKDVSVREMSNTFHRYKGIDRFKKKTTSKLRSLKDKLTKCRENCQETPSKIREAVYAGSSYLMKASSALDRLITASHENTVNTLIEFVNCEVSENAAIQFENAVERFNRSREIYDDDDDDFIK